MNVLIEIPIWKRQDTIRVTLKILWVSIIHVTQKVPNTVSFLGNNSFIAQFRI